MRLKLLLGASFAITIIIGGLALVPFSLIPTQNTGELRAGTPSLQLNELEQNQSSVPHPPFVDELWGAEISLEEAKELATLSGLDLRIPQNLPPSYILADVRADGFRVNDKGETVPGLILLIFAPDGVKKADLIPSKFPELRAFSLYVSRGSPDFEERFLYNKANQGEYDIFNEEGAVIGRGNRIVRGEPTTVNGLFAVHEPGSENDRPGPRRELKWEDEGTRFLLTADAEAFPLARLLTIAESI